MNLCAFRSPNTISGYVTTKGTIRSAKYKKNSFYKASGNDTAFHLPFPGDESALCCFGATTRGTVSFWQSTQICHTRDIEPGVVFTGNYGKKRMVPVLQIGHNGMVPRELATPAQTRMISCAIMDPKEASLGSGYLGMQKLDVDSVFYLGIRVGQEVPPGNGVDGSFCQSYADISTGRRLYINKRMKFLLRSHAVDFTRHGKGFAAVIPYPARLKSRFHAPSFSLFYTAPSGKVIATREDLTA
ncbi:hypothetical protein VE03_10491 [Pseudogymnoascus sp. 23342-1-I1]|nr:hypothetical protein VE03_10491 [Pseudogymnoascus sp. 23342-1-I1]